MIEWGVTGLLLLTPFAVGSAEPWAFTSMEVAIFLLSAIIIVKLLAGKAETFTFGLGNPSMIFPLLFLTSLAAFQLLPLPPSLERLISPSTYEFYRNSLPRWPDHPVYD